MNIKQLREWLFLNSLENDWWINVDGKSLEKSENLDMLERILWKNPNSKVLVLHVSQSQLASPPWIEVEHGSLIIGSDEEARSKINSNILLPPPPPPLPDPAHNSPQPPMRAGIEHTAPRRSAYSSPQFNNRLNLLFSFKGRINRKQFILGYLLKWALIFVVGFLFFIFEKVISNADFLLFPLFLIVLLAIAIIWLNFALIVRRLKDTGSTPWVLILLLIPGLNFLLGPLIILLCVILPSGKKEAKKYGDAPYDIF